MYLATEQIFHGRLVEGERALWALVLSSAIEDLACCSDGGLPQKGVRWERRALALQWIVADDTNVGSFQFTCDVLELDATAVRERVLRADQQQLGNKSEYAQHRESKPEPLVSSSSESSEAPENTGKIADESPYLLPKIDVNNLSRNQPNITNHATIVVQKKARVITMINGNGQSHFDWLKGQAARLQEQLAAAEAVCMRLKPVVANIQSVIAALADPDGSSADPNEAAKPKRTVEPALARRPPYEDVPINNALAQILKTSTDGMHHDDLTRAVFAVGDAREFERAKSSVTARLSVGAKSGLFKALGGGRYQIANGAMQSPG